MRILVVDDEEINLFLLKEILEDGHYEALTSADGQRGLELARQQQPDLVLLDIQMPSMNGLEVLQALKSDPATEKIPVIFLTGLGHSTDIVRGLRLGADEYITKPFGSGDELMARIATVLRIRESEARAMQLAQHLQALQGVALAINQGLELTRTIESVVKLTVSVGEFDWAGVVLDDGTPPTFSRGVRSEVQQLLSSVPMETIITQERTLIVNDVKTLNDETHRALRYFNIGSYIGVPIHTGSATLGTLYAMCHETQTFTQQNTQAVEGIAMHAAIAIQNARLYERVKSLEETKTQMISMASHDLRNPLTIATNSISMLSDDLRASGELSPDQEQLLGLAERSLGQMEQLIEDILTTGRIEAMIAQGPEPLRIDDLLQQVCEAAEVQAAAAQQTLTLNIEDALPIVRGYEHPLREAVANLVTNALKYTPKGGTVYVTARASHREVQIEVQDNGIGIPEDKQSRLFEPFYRARQPGTEQIVGSGLGLSMVKQVIEQHGGHVWFRSTPGLGSTFGIALPIMSSQAGAEGHISETAGA